jgi:hypothetical protein
MVETEVKAAVETEVEAVMAVMAMAMARLMVALQENCELCLCPGQSVLALQILQIKEHKW